MNPPAELIDDLRLLEPPRSWLAQYGWIVAVFAGLLAAWWWYCRQRAKRAAAAARAAAAEQAPEDALAELARLFALIDEERSRPYALESSAIIRRYLERRFDLAAPRLSTEEFLDEARRAPQLNAEFQGLLADFLRCCDVLKFARTVADRTELTQLHEAATHFVTETSR
jgi:hypothetical protein